MSAAAACYQACPLHGPVASGRAGSSARAAGAGAGAASSSSR
jgi:hypothetical protein